MFLTEDVMEPRVAEARAVVDIWPIDTTEAMESEYSRA